MASEIVHTFKAVLAGDRTVGKTTFLKRFTAGESGKQVVAAMRAEMFPLVFQTNIGAIRFDVWDTDAADLRCAKDAHAAILMFDVTSRITHTNIPLWHKRMEAVCGNIPVVLCGNKVDVPSRKVKPESIYFHRKISTAYFEVSAKSNYQVIKPFFRLAQVLVGPTLLDFSVDPVLAAPETPQDTELMARYSRELLEAADLPLPEDDGEI